MTALKRGLRTIVGTCAAVVPREKVLVVTDDRTEDCARLLKDTAAALGAEAGICKMAAREIDGQEPEAEVGAAMLKADAVLLAVSRSLAHTVAVQKSLSAGARILSLTALSKALIASRAFRSDFAAQKPICEKVARCFTSAADVRISSPAGTDLKVSAAGRSGNAHCCIVEKPGQFSSAPNIEASFAPLEGTMDGRLVVDASIPYLNIGRVDRPVVFTITAGRVVKISGSAQADTISRILREQNDPNVYNVAQVAVGLNPKVKKPLGFLGCNYDEGAFGTVHIGIGTSAGLGGRIQASVHFDALMNAPTLTIDGSILLSSGRLRLAS